ncbi:uncharacterized protein LOC105157814 [Sesamum indicum]|uniref:Uncharacterized protein LOC105157814 n=1 Tax=Sesamum indicum TaxID=4182 RepID=A0A6I9SR40_SESIN|nr:uncharacterized protein LOC105157814 [Sesamum indicum]
MSTSIISDSMVITPGPDGPAVTGAVSKISGQIDVDFAKCDCCGLTEECTLSYIETIRERYGGKWICGLCAEAVKYEILRCQKLISPDEAMARHFSFCNKFRASGPPQDPTVHLIRAMTQVLRKSLESPKSMRSMPSSPTNKRGELDMKGTVLARSESCMPSLTLVDATAYCGVDEGYE